jgi:hypothetical protein
LSHANVRGEIQRRRASVDAKSESKRDAVLRELAAIAPFRHPQGGAVGDPASQRTLTGKKVIVNDAELLDITVLDLTEACRAP